MGGGGAHPVVVVIDDRNHLSELIQHNEDALLTLPLRTSDTITAKGETWHILVTRGVQVGMLLSRALTLKRPVCEHSGKQT